jgi:NAD(P)-dependent dehydrogenase (short-subunit alcohol dehydrogenase family)
VDLKGKTVVISGGSSGIGRATALMLAERGAEVIVIGRDPTKGAEIEAALKQSSGGVGSFLRADLSLLSEARRVVVELTARVQKIDAFIQSAGVIDMEKSKTAEGLDKMFVINFLHKLLLAEGLAPLLAAARGRMVLVATRADRTGLDWSNFEGARGYAGALSMLQLHGASLAIAQRLAEDWKARGIGVTAINPGQVDTEIIRSLTGVWKWGAALRNFFLAQPEKPAALLCWLAFSAEAQELSGSFFPSTSKFGKRRLLARDAPTLDRVFKTAHAVLASV